MEIAISQERINNPALISQDLYDLGSLLDDNKMELNSIKDRGVFKRMFSNNTADIAEQMLKQNEALSLFLNVLQSVVVLTSYNSVHIANIYEKFNIKTNTDKSVTNKYFSYAKEFLQGAMTSTAKVKQKFDTIDENIDRMKQSIGKKDKVDYEQDKIIEELKAKLLDDEKKSKVAEEKLLQLEKELTQDKEIDKQQTEKITELSSALNQKEILDKQQTEKIIELSTALNQKNSLDNQQSDKIAEMEILIKNQNEKIKVLEASISNSELSIVDKQNNFKSIIQQNRIVSVIAILLSAVGIILSIVLRIK